MGKRPYVVYGEYEGDIQRIHIFEMGRIRIDYLPNKEFPLVGRAKWTKDNEDIKEIYYEFFRNREGAVSKQMKIANDYDQSEYEKAIEFFERNTPENSKSDQVGENLLKLLICLDIKLR